MSDDLIQKLRARVAELEAALNAEKRIQRDTWNDAIREAAVLAEQSWKPARHILALLRNEGGGDDREKNDG